MGFANPDDSCAAAENFTLNSHFEGNIRNMETWFTCTHIYKSLYIY